jgi:hypothetical protein
MAKIIPILFKTEMVKAILDGTKTQTRRILKPQPHPVTRHGLTTQTTYEWDYSKKVTDLPEFEWLKLSPIKKGDILYVRETFGIEGNTSKFFIYKADVKHFNGKWRSSLHMPKTAARIFLKVVSVKVERLKDISQEDAAKEGVKKKGNMFFNYFSYTKHMDEDFFYSEDQAKSSFMSLWFKIMGASSWIANPWVWVIEFEQTESPFTV